MGDVSARAILNFTVAMPCVHVPYSTLSVERRQWFNIRAGLATLAIAFSLWPALALATTSCHARLTRSGFNIDRAVCKQPALQIARPSHALPRKETTYAVRQPCKAVVWVVLSHRIELHDVRGQFSR